MWVQKRIDDDVEEQAGVVKEVTCFGGSINLCSLLPNQPFAIMPILYHVVLCHGLPCIVQGL